MGLKEDLSLKKVLAYAKACCSVADYLSALQSDYRTVVIPSRGAFPIYRTADYARVYNGGSDYYPHEEIIYPFTADECQGVPSKVTRKHWGKVLAADSTGIPNESWEYYQSQCEKFGLKRNSFPYGFGSFVMIDTAISGKAASEIVKVLENCCLDYHLLLVVDHSGKKLKSQYKTVLDKYQSKITKILVPRLYTEDRGIALMGITSILFPDLTLEEHVMSTWTGIEVVPIFWNGEKRIPKIDTATHFFSFIHAMHFYATKIILKKPFDGDFQAVEYFRESLIANSNVVDRSSTLSACSNLKKFGEVSCSSSMAIKINTNIKNNIYPLNSNMIGYISLI